VWQGRFKAFPIELSKNRRIEMVDGPVGDGLGRRGPLRYLP